MRGKRELSFILLAGFLFFMLAFAKADVVSVNSGGSINLVITPDKYIEGFFSQIPSPIIPVTPPSGGGETGGGGGGGAATASNIVVVPTELSIDTTVNSTVERAVTISNYGSSSATINISQTGLDGIALIGLGTSDTLTLAAGESKVFTITFKAPGTAGNYAGTINIGDKKVLVSLNVKTSQLLFDSHIVVLNPLSTVSQGNDLKTQVTLIPMSNDQVRTDVTLNYEIKDYNGTTYQKKSETILVTSLTNLYRNFNTNQLPPGKYLVSLELVYSNGIAPSSAQFEVTPKSPLQRILGFLVFALIIGILAIGVFIIIVIIIRIIKRNRAISNFNEGSQRRLNQSNS